MPFIDYYKILQIDKLATQETIKKAYRTLARKLHPDLNPNDKEAHKKFQEINEAHEVLSNVEKREKYDKYGNDWQHAEEIEKNKQQQQQYAAQNESAFSNDTNGDFSSFFESMFGSNAHTTQPKYKGQDYHTEITLTLLEAMETQAKILNVNNKKIRVTIPAGIANGQIISISGHGAAGINGGPNGDLLITFAILPNTQFKRLGNDLYTTVTIDLYTAILGGETVVTTISGDVKLKVKPETIYGTKVRLKGKGFPVYKNEGKFGDLYITYNIELPINLTDKQKELFTQLSTLK